MNPKPLSGEIRKFVIDHVERHPRDVAKRTAEQFGITRQAVNRHLAILVEDDILEAEGRTREKAYRLKVTEKFYDLPLADHRDEDKVWRSYVSPFLSGLRDHVASICHYGFTEMFNNVIDHSEGTKGIILLTLSAKTVSITISDDGVGVFEKIRRKFALEDYRHAILELAKGKLTTDPVHHSGQGIFFTSRMFDTFSLVANKMRLEHVTNSEDWLFEQSEAAGQGTTVAMRLDVDTDRTCKSVFDRYSDWESDDLDFSRTHVPLALAKYGRDNLLSRSQAKRVLSRFENFKEVVLDFNGADSIGQAFADEIFRVFAAQNPAVGILAVNMNDDVKRMVSRAQKARRVQEGEEESKSWRE